VIQSVPKHQRVIDDEFRAFVRRQPCLLAAWEPCTCGPYIDVSRKMIATRFCHVRSRGAGGGDAANGWPGCDHHHGEQHRLGRKTFEAKYGLSLTGVARELWAQYQADPEASREAAT